MTLRILLLAVLSCLALPRDLAAQEGPRPPCGNDPVPAFAAPAAPQNVKVWRAEGSKAGEWKFPACRGWRSGAFKLQVALAGSFRHDGTADDLLSRFGRVSEMRNIRYWSVSDQAWRPLIQDAGALEGPEPAQRREDFAIGDLKAGGAFHFLQVETRLSVPIVYRMRILELRPDRVVVETENVTAVRIGLIPIVQPGETRAVHVLIRLSPGLWGYYLLALSGQDAPLFLRVRDESLINRASALYRHIAGIPTDREPPLAR